MRASDFDFELPAELIAQQPSAERSDSRLLAVLPHGLADHRFKDLPSLLARGDLLIMNDTRVIKARLLGRKPDSGGKVEALIERVTGDHDALAQIRASKTPRPGSTLLFGTARVTIAARQGEFFELRFDEPVLEVLQREGHTPLPPYIVHAPDAGDDRRYQTVYAREAGAIAAPTAGLHFDEPLLAALEQAGVRRAFLTLHVGAGTFAPLRVDDLAQHRMHSERYSIPAATAEAIARTRAAGGRIVAVGTTSLRALESAARDDGSVAAGSAETQIFITPGYDFRIVDALITNFHLPRSTLLILVSAFAGSAAIRAAYAHAIVQRYRFFSYGDAMLLQPGSITAASPA